MANRRIHLTAILRQQALAAGEKYYSTGKKCRNGHLDVRIASTGFCRSCKAINSRKDREKHKSRCVAYAKAHYLENKEARNLKSRAYHEARKHDPLYQEKRRKYREDNRESLNKGRSKWAKANPDKRKLICSKWSKSNPEKTRAIWQNRRARLRKAEGSFSDDDIVRIRKLQKNKCAICKNKLIDKPRMIHIDHIVAITKDGTNWPRNLQLLCQPCNNKKWNHDQISFMQSLGFLL